VNERDKVMTENLTKRLVSHRNISLASQAVAKLAFHHAERGFDVRPFVVVLQKLGAPELKVVIHPGPRSPALRNLDCSGQRPPRECGAGRP